MRTRIRVPMFLRRIVLSAYYAERNATDCRHTLLRLYRGRQSNACMPPTWSSAIQFPPLPGHPASPPSSGFAAPALRFGAFGVTAACRRGKSPPCLFGERQRPSGRFAHQRDMAAKEPAARAAVNVREATAQRLDVDGEHGAGMRGAPSGARHRRLIPTPLVMAGLVPAIHAGPPSPPSNDNRDGAAWVAGTSPAMTLEGCAACAAAPPFR